jgi:hypothetical protein
MKLVSLTCYYFLSLTAGLANGGEGAWKETPEPPADQPGIRPDMKLYQPNKRGRPRMPDFFNRLKSR